MRSNIIITVGTSQIQRKKIEEVWPSKAGLFSLLQNDPSDVNNQDAIVRDLDQLIESLAEHPGHYGAEISTLQTLKEEQNLDYSVNGNFVLISSDTIEGKIARRILYENLIKIWGISEGRILPARAFINTDYVVEGLSEKPVSSNQIDQAMECLTRIFKEVLISHGLNKPAEYENVCIMSGGFKCVVPCLTMLSLIYGFKLLYLFEDSNFLQSIHPRNNSNDENEHAFWIETLKKLQKEKRIELKPYLQIALTDRLSRDRENQVFE